MLSKIQNHHNMPVEDDFVDWLTLFVAEVVGPYNNFQDGQPDSAAAENCVALSYLNFRMWRAIDCIGYHNAFVCSKGCL